MKKIICPIKTIWRNKHPLIWFGGINTYVDGCDYIEQENGDLICEVCGRNDKREEDKIIIYKSK